MRLSLVVPAFNEALGLEPFLDALSETARTCSSDYEMIVVDDGSTDGTWDIVRRLSGHDARVGGLRLTRNFGKEMAILAGLESATGQAAIIVDADLQHPLELIPQMVTIWRESGVPIVEAVKASRQPEGVLRRLGSLFFYRFFEDATGLRLAGATDFKLLDRRVIDDYLRLPERNRFFRGLTSWLGYPSEEIPFTPASRAHGTSSWSFLRLVSLAWSSIKAFSIAPLRAVVVLGLLTLTAAGALGLQTLWRWWTGAAAPGFATVILLQLAIGSVLMISVGLVGEYVGQVYEELKRRPRYVLRDRIGKVSSPRADP